jgi:REP element-mobilizing transposase RayT
MSEKFQNRYRIPSARLKNWDYGSNAMYFVTICTAHREYYFGKITKGKMVLSEIGRIAHQCWQDISTHFPFVELGEFVVMPNHVHGIIIIDKRVNANDDGDGGAIVETQNFASLPINQINHYNQMNQITTTTPTGNKFGPQSKNLASIIRGFKIGVSKYARNNNLNFAWQSRFHDHIIRNDKSFLQISNYIANNPSKWTDDKFFNKT